MNFKTICRDQLHGCDYSAFFEEDNAKKALALTQALNFMLAPKMEPKRKHLVEHAALLHNAQTLCRSLLDKHDKVEVAFFDALRVMISRFTQTTGAKITRKEINRRINDLLKQSIKSDGVINLFADAKQEFSLFDEDFMKEIQKMKEKNIALELIKRLLKKYKYPPEGAEEALQIVMAQCDNWAENEDNYVERETKYYHLDTYSEPYRMVAEEEVLYRPSRTME